jgi:hypothetical protein
MTRMKLSERFTGKQLFESADLSELDNGIVRRALLISPVSSNQRVYTADALRNAVAKYNTVANLDHDWETSVANRFGYYDNATYDEATNRIYADLHFLKSHPFAAQFMEAVRRMPHVMGFSHVAQCEGETNPDGVYVISTIHDVLSVDIVADPATTGGIFESVQMIPTDPNAGKPGTKPAENNPTPAPVEPPVPNEDDDGAPEPTASGGSSPNSVVGELVKAFADALIKGEMTLDDAKEKIGVALGLIAGENDDESDDEVPTESKKSRGRADRLFEKYKLPRNLRLPGVRESIGKMSPAAADKFVAMLAGVRESIGPSAPKSNGGGGRKPLKTGDLIGILRGQ